MGADFSQFSMTQSWDQFKVGYKSAIGLWIQLDALTHHNTILTGNLDPLIDAVWLQLESEARAFPGVMLPVTSAKIQETIADVVTFYLTGKHPQQERLDQAIACINELSERLEHWTNRYQNQDSEPGGDS